MTTNQDSFTHTIVSVQKFLLGFLVGNVAIQLACQVFFPFITIGTILTILLLQLLRVNQSKT